MHVEPDRQCSAHDQHELARLTQSVLARTPFAVTLEEAAHPAVAEAAHVAQRVTAARPGAPPEARRVDALGDLLTQARAVIARSRAVRHDHPEQRCWAVDPAVPAPHLQRSVARALRSVPAAARRGENTRSGGSTVATWRESNRAVLGETAALLASVWPRMHEELGDVLVQIALLDGPAIDGFTDFAVHGAVFVRRERLMDGQQDLPGRVRLAEALVHEGAHTRCNASAVVGGPFLQPDDGAQPRVATPLRADPRPLAGLFQQLVVLARSVRLYQHLLDTGSLADTQVRAATTRHDHLVAGAGQAAHILAEHRRALTERGRHLVDEAREFALAGA